MTRSQSSGYQGLLKNGGDMKKAASLPGNSAGDSSGAFKDSEVMFYEKPKWQLFYEIDVTCDKPDGWLRYSTVNALIYKEKVIKIY